jgi:hypothetical protein
MPEKWKPDSREYNRRTGITTTIRSYIKGTLKQELLDCIENENSKPKMVHKAKKELARRALISGS